MYNLESVNDPTLVAEVQAKVLELVRFALEKLHLDTDAALAYVKIRLLGLYPLYDVYVQPKFDNERLKLEINVVKRVTPYKPVLAHSVGL